MSARTVKYLRAGLARLRGAKTCVGWASSLTQCTESERANIEATMLRLNHEVVRLCRDIDAAEGR